MDSRGFFSALFGEDALPGSLVLWKPGKPARSEWCEGAAEAADRCLQGKYPYFGCALQDQDAARAAAQRDRGVKTLPRPHTVRGFVESATAIPGVWLDVDVQGPGHTKAGLPPTCAAAEELLRTFPAAPTLTVYTGGGFHVWWLFHELWVFDSPDEREKAGKLVEAWQGYISSGFRAKGWSMDSTFDLTRVLRPPGTRNDKYDAEVTCGDEEGPRWNSSELDDLIPGACWDIVRRRNGRSAHRADVVADEQAAPPSEKLMVLIDNSASFATTWRRERKDLPSQSEYDLALASMAINAGWSDQEAADLIVAHRRMGGKPKKHAKYYAATISKAKRVSASDEAVERISARVEEVAEGGGDMEPQQKRAAIDDISSALGLPIVGIIKYTSDPPTYRLRMAEGEINLGSVRTILNASSFREAVAAVADRAVRRFRNAQWDPIAQLIMDACEKQDLGSYSSAEGVSAELVCAYVRRRKPIDDREEAHLTQRPFWYASHLHVFLGDLRKWIALTLGERYSSVALAKLLRAAGCTPKTIAVTVAGKATSMSAWRVTDLVGDAYLAGASTESEKEKGPDGGSLKGRTTEEDRPPF